MNYLVTGRSGTGKSALASELQKRGYNAIDGDKMPRLCRWENAATGEPVEVDWRGYVDYAKVAWNWNEQVLSQLLASQRDLILCGSASNELAFFPLFDKVFVLTLPPEVQKERILTRTGNDYGKHPDTLQETLEDQKIFIEEALSLGAIAIDAAQPLENVANNILDYVHGY